MMDDVELVGLMREVASNTRMIAQLLALSVAAELPKRLTAVLDNDSKLAAYAASDGIRSAREVGRISGTSHPTIGNWWREWQGAGLATDAGEGRAAARFDIEMLGIVGPFAGGQSNAR